MVKQQVNDLIEIIRQQANSEQERLVRNKLGLMGYLFKSNEEYIDFVKMRVSAVKGLSLDTDVVEVWLDRGTPKQVLLGCLFHPPRVKFVEPWNSGDATVTVASGFNLS